MRRLPHQVAALTEALNEAISRFQADVLRLARLDLRARTQTAAVAKPGKPATLSPPARSRGAVEQAPRTRPAAATRPRKPATIPAATRARKPPRASELSAAPAEGRPKPARARRASTQPTESTLPPPPTPRPETTLHPAPVEPIEATSPADRARPALPTYVTPTADPPDTGPHEAPPAIRARNGRDDRAQQQQQRQERARLRRAAEEARIGSLHRSGERENLTAPTAPEAPSTEAQHREAAEFHGAPSRGGLRRGTVKWFSKVKGYGFIQADDGGPDAFVHQSSIAIEGFRSLSEGEMVSYEEQQSPKGLVAVNVRPIDGLL